MKYEIAAVIDLSCSTCGQHHPCPHQVEKLERKVNEALNKVCLEYGYKAMGVLTLEMKLLSEDKHE